MRAAAFVRRPTHLSEQVGTDAVVLDLERDRYYGLGASAAQLWALLERPCTEQQLVEALIAGFEVDRELATADVSRWVHELLRLDLIRPAPPGPP